MQPLRTCQQEAIDCVRSRVTTETETNLSLCTGAGKSIIIRSCSQLDESKRCILVFPSLMLLQQFYEDHKMAYSGLPVFYLATERTLRKIPRLSAGMGELTAPAWYVFTTYASAPDIYARLDDTNIPLVIFHDEAHHVTAPIYGAAFANIAPRLHTVNLSATLPNSKAPHYKYPLLKGIRDGVVRDFNLDLFLCVDREYDDPARATALLELIINKLLTHHPMVKLLIYTREANTTGEGASSVSTFLAAHAAAFRAHGWWIEGIKEDTVDRVALLRGFEQSTAPVTILVSCQTLSEGIDLKGANCMLPWDPTASVVVNIQRIGRVLRLYKNAHGKILNKEDQTSSTVLIPVFLPAADYEACGGDRMAIHTLLETQIAEGERGNFHPIINVCTALKSELAEDDAELFNALLNYPRQPKVAVDRGLVECVAKACKKSAEDVLEEVAAALQEKEMDEVAEAVREGEWSEEEAGDVVAALADTQGITLVVRDGDEAEMFGKGAQVVTVEKHGEGYKPVKNGTKKAVADMEAARKRVAHRMRVNFSDECQILLGLDSVEGADTTGGMVLTRLTTEVQVDENWEARRLEWVAQYEKLGRCPSNTSKDLDEARAARWQTHQRQNYKNKSSCMTSSRIDSLNTTHGWQWEVSDTGEPNRLIWVEVFEKLGRNPSQTSKDPTEKRAAQWQCDQRRYYYGKKAFHMLPSRITALNATPGWKWEEEDTWEPNRLHWIEQYEQLGRPPSSTSTDPNEKKAGIWQGNQRNGYNKNVSHMTPERIATLNATPGWSWENEDTWEPNRLNWLIQFEKLGYSPPISATDPAEKRAAQWQSDQRKGYKKNASRMTPERIAILNTTPGWQWDNEDTWEPSRLQWLAQFTKFSRAPSNSSTNLDEARAARWQSSQRSAYKQRATCLTSERIATLNTTPGWQWEADDTWESNKLNWITQYKKLGYTPSQKSKNLEEKQAGSWQCHQRKDYKKKATWMTPERISILSSIPGWLWADEDTWEPSRLQWLAQFIKLRKSPSPTSNDSSEKKSGNWQTVQRRAYTNKLASMTPARISTLNATPGWTWSAKEPPVTPYIPADTPTLTIDDAAVADTIQHVPAEAPPLTIRKRKVPKPAAEKPAAETPAQKTARERSALEELHKRYKSMNADTYASTIAANPAEFAAYHDVADAYDARDPPERQPLTKIAAMLAPLNRPSYTAIDLGCGRNRLRTLPAVNRMKWTSVDAHAVDESVTVADMGTLPYEDETYDVAVLCRSLWARNHEAVLRETWRILKVGGRAVICESFQRWLSADGQNELLQCLREIGFTVIHEEGTHIDDDVDDVFQYITVRK